MAIFSRILAAIVGGYLFTNVMSLLLVFAFVDYSEILAAQKSDTVNREFIVSIFNSMAISQLMSFVIYTVAAMWVFHTRSATRAWAGLILPSLMGAWLIYFLLPRELIVMIKGAIA